jgi:hypothetical protein
VETFNLERKNFPLEIQESENEYIATVHHPHLSRRGHTYKDKSGELLGFVRYSKGIVELTNFGAQLRRAALGVGDSTKQEKEYLAGNHGEGFKVASLVMLRRGYQVRFAASGYYWNFRFGGSDMNQLYCHLSPISEAALRKQKEAHSARVGKGASRELVANPWEDVSVQIGKIRGPRGLKVSMADFRDWLKVSMDLDRPSNVVKTAYGDLILDPEFSGRVYLKELLLKNSASPFKYKFGYNLSRGDVNRERQSMESSVEEAKTIARIWDGAIQNNPADTLNEYVMMLREDTSRADVNHAKDYISETTANSIWQYLLAKDPDKRLFYLGRKNGKRVCCFCYSRLIAGDIELTTLRASNLLIGA